MTFKLETTYEVPVGKLDSVFNIDTSNMTEATLNFIFRHGLKQLVNDSHSGKKEEDKIQEAVARKIEALQTNATSTRASGDDVHTEYKKVAFDWLSKSTGQTKKALETFRKEQGITTTELLELVCTKLGEAYEDVRQMLDERIAASKVEASELAASIDFDDLLQK